MSNQPDDKLLDENISRLLNATPDCPQLPADAEQSMLDALAAKQTELYPAKEKTMDAIAPTLKIRETSFSFPAALLIAASLGAVVVVALWMNQNAAPGISGGGSPAGIAKTIEVERSQRQQLEDGTIVIAREGAKYTVDAKRQLTLAHGDLYLIVAKSEQPFVVHTKDGRVTAHGTRFTVSANKKTKAAVAQGRVELSSKAGSIQLRAGQQGTLAADTIPQRQAAPRLSYQVNWAKEHLSQQGLLVKQVDVKSGLVAIDPWGQEMNLTLRKYQIDVHIEDGIARTTIDQTFFNHNPGNTEGTFYFPLPPDGSVSRLAMYVNGGLNEGGMVERGYGQEVYNDIRYQWRDPALLEMMEGNVFKMRIFPLEGRQEKRVFLSYTQTLQELYGTMRYWFPMDHTHSTANQLAIRVRIKDGAKSLSPQSSTHKLKTTIEGNDLVLTYHAEDVKPDQDLLLNLLPSEKLASSRITTSQKAGHRFLFARIHPELSGTLKHQPRQWIVLNDVSASRTAIEAEAQSYIVDRLLQEADDDDSFAVIDLNTRATPKTDGFLSIEQARKTGFSLKTSAHSDRSIRLKARLLGATNIEAGLEAIASLLKNHPAKNPHILYLGDGVATDGQTEIAALVRQLPGAATFVGIGVGKKVEAKFLQSAADATGGVFAVINPDEDIDWRVFDLLAALNTPRLTGLKVSLEADGRETEETIAYPNARVVSEGETLQVVARFGADLPSQLVLRGQLNDKPWSKTFDLTDARESAEYIPRLWAKRHIDELLKSGSEFKDEVVNLSKQYYVVTPHTSLIVLEDDAMYEKYKVERGRKDHWALYQAPKKIEVVKEPIDWSRWNGWGRVWQGEDESVKATTKPQTVNDIVESVQFRVNAPFYYWQPQQGGQGRHALYQLIDTEADPTRSLTYLFATATGKPLPSTGAKDGRSGDSTSGPTKSGQKNGQWGVNRQGLYWEGVGGGGGGGGGGIAFRPQLFASRTRSLRGELMLPSFATMGSFHGGKLVDDSKSMQRELGGILSRSRYFRTSRLGLSVMHGNLVNEERYLGEIPILGSGFRINSLEVNKRLAPRGMLRGLPASGLDGYFSDELSAPVMQSYDRAMRERWSRMDRDVGRFNQQYGGVWNWSGSGATGTIDLNGGFGEGWARDLQNTMFVTETTDERPLQLRRLGAIVNGKRWRSFQYGFDRGTASGPQMASLGRAMTTLPGVCAILAADHLVPRRAELQEAAQQKSEELELTELALSGTETAQARLESSGPFWSWNGWNYRPQPSTFQPPTVQAYPHYNWTFDLTRYADGLYSTQFDVLNEVVERYGQAKAAGKISDDARSRIEKARAAIRPVRIGDKEAGVDVLVASGDRYVVIGRSDMYLHERMVCDGKHLFREYAELGLIARRKATSLRLASLRQMVPHLVQPTDAMVQRFDVKLENSDDAHFTIRLTPVGQKEKDKDRYHLLVRVGNDGRIDEKQLMINDRQQLKLAYQYEDKKVVVRWIDKKEKQLAEQSYLAAEVAADVITKDTFKSVDLSDQVVIDMPLRRPSYYKQKLEELDDDLTDEEVRLNRHLSLASLQQLHTRRWGQGNVEAQKAITDAIDLLNTSGAKATLGDLTLLGSAGCTSTQQFDKVTLPATQRVNRYLRMRLSSWDDAMKIRDEHPNTLVGHLSAYYVTSQHRKGDDSEFEKFIKQYSDSPLVLAAAWTRANWGNKPEAWSPLYEHPRWRGMAVLMSAGQIKTAEQRAKWAPAFQKWHDEYVDAGYELAIPMRVVNQLKQYENGKLWRKVVIGKWQRARKQKRLAPRLAFAENAMSWGETEFAEKALLLVCKQIDKREALLPKLALAQAYWAGGRPQDALKLYDEVLASLQEKKIVASPALLASMARLAQQAGDLGRAIDLEEQALEAEHPYLPERINLQAFRQRYNWLGQQLQTKVQQATQQKDEKGVTDWLSRAMIVWQRWFEIDPQNPAMIRQMATMLEDAGRSDDAWMYLSTVIDQKPKDANSYFQVGQWYLTRSNPDKAQEYYATAFTWDTANPRWLVERANVLKQMKRHDDSRRLYQQVLEGKWAPGLQGYVNQAKEALK